MLNVSVEEFHLPAVREEYIRTSIEPENRLLRCPEKKP